MDCCDTSTQSSSATASTTACTPISSIAGDPLSSSFHSVTSSGIIHVSCPAKPSKGQHPRPTDEDIATPATPSQTSEPAPKRLPPPSEDTAIHARLKAAALRTSKADESASTTSSAPHRPAILPSSERMYLAWYPSLDVDNIKGTTIRDDLSQSEQRICAHRCTSDSAFYKAVRRQSGLKLVGRGSTPFFDSASEGKSRVWRCAERGCKASAWITMETDTRMLTVEVERQ